MGSNIEKRRMKKLQSAHILKMMYFGDPNHEWVCLVSGQELIVYTKSFTTGEIVERWHGQFDHIREIPNIKKFMNSLGFVGSIDANGTSITDKWRSHELGNFKDVYSYKTIFEFMCTMIYHQDTHHDKTSDVKKSTEIFTLSDIEPEYYPWFLKSQENFNKFCDYVGLKNLKYKTFLKHLQDPNAPSIHECKWVKELCPVVGPLMRSEVNYIRKEWYAGKGDTLKEFCEYYGNHYNTIPAHIKKVVKNLSTEKRKKIIEARRIKKAVSHMKVLATLRTKPTTKSITMKEFDIKMNKSIGYTTRMNGIVSAA
jgi:hypothetical protein